MATDDRYALSLKNRLNEANESLKAFRAKVTSRISEGTDPIVISGLDIGGGVLALAEKAGIEAAVDKFRKVATPIGQYRAPNVYSGAISTALGVLTYFPNVLTVAPVLGNFPLAWYRALPKTMSLGLTILGLKELGQVAVVWNENRQLENTRAAAAAQIAAAQQQAALADAQKK